MRGEKRKWLDLGNHEVAEKGSVPRATRGGGVAANGPVTAGSNLLKKKKGRKEMAQAAGVN